MNRKNIQRHLKTKIDKWTATIKDKELVKDINRDIVITGGAIVSLLLKEDINDYDVYFKTKSTTLKVAQYYVKEWSAKHKSSSIHIFADESDYQAFFERKKNEYMSKEKEIDDETAEKYIFDEMGTYYDDRVSIYIPSNGVVGDYHDMNNFEQSRTYDIDNDTREKNYSGKYEPIFISSNAITLTDQIQIICRFFGEPDEIHKYFDYLHATAYYTNGKLHTTTEILEAIMAKELIYRGSKYPLCSVIRLRKFIKRGWTISAGQVLKMCININDFDLTDIEVLKDQLIGVDSAYFSHIIGMIQQDLNDGTINNIDGSYICELVDKIF